MINLTNNLFELSSTVIIVITWTLLYFGKIIADTKVEKLEKTDLIISGLYFSLLFLMIPIALNIYFFQKNWIFNISLIGIIIFQLIIFVFYLMKYQLDIINRSNLKETFNKELNKFKRTNQVTDDKRETTRSKGSNPTTINIGLFILSTALFYSLAIVIKYHLNVLSLTLTVILTFVNLSLMASAYGTSTAYYPFSKITLTNGKNISGKLMKFGDFIWIINGKKKYFINKNHVEMIEQNLMKKDDIQDEKEKTKPNWIKIGIIPAHQKGDAINVFPKEKNK